MEKKLAMRTCIATGTKDEKRNMIRIVRRANGEVVIDVKGKEKGRGANLIMELEAFDLAVKKNAIERALKLAKKLTAIQIDSLRTDFRKGVDEKKLRKGTKVVSFKISKEDFDKIQNTTSATE